MNDHRSRIPRVYWSKDPDFGRLVDCKIPEARSSSGAIGKWGECLTRNYLLAKGSHTAKHAIFRVSNRKLVSDLFDPFTLTVYEVKTGTRSVNPYFRSYLRLFAELLNRGSVRLVVYVHVCFGGSTGFSPSQSTAIRNAGFEVLTIGAQGTGNPLPTSLRRLSDQG